VPDVNEIHRSEVVIAQQSDFHCCKIEQSDFEFLEVAISAHAKIQELHSDDIAETPASSDTGAFDWLSATATQKVESGDAIDEPVHDGLTLLSLASLAGRLPVVMMLHRAGADLDIRDIRGSTSLMLAVEADHLEVVRHLLQSRADPEVRSKGQRAAIHIAVDLGYVGITQAFIESSSDIAAKTSAGATPLHIAARRNNGELCQALLSARADMEAKEGSWDSSVLLSSIRHASAECALMLVDAKADLKTVDNLGRTPLIIAARENHQEIVQMLLDNDALADAQDNQGCTAEMHASKRGLTDIAQILKLRRDKDLNAIVPSELQAVGSEDGPSEKPPGNLLQSMSSWCQMAQSLDTNMLSIDQSVSIARDNPRVFLKTLDTLARD